VLTSGDSEFNKIDPLCTKRTSLKLRVEDKEYYGRSKPRNHGSAQRRGSYPSLGRSGSEGFWEEITFGVTLEG
jgi:hypothetical protein